MASQIRTLLGFQDSARRDLYKSSFRLPGGSRVDTANSLEGMIEILIESGKVTGARPYDWILMSMDLGQITPGYSRVGLVYDMISHDINDGKTVFLAVANDAKNAELARKAKMPALALPLEVQYLTEFRSDPAAYAKFHREIREGTPRK